MPHEVVPKPRHCRASRDFKSTLYFEVSRGENRPTNDHEARPERTKASEDVLPPTCAPQIITYGKRNTDPSYRSAQSYLFQPGHVYGFPSTPQKVEPPLPPEALLLDQPEKFRPTTNLLPKIFGTLRERYADRPGGYTRIQRFGKRPGDNAPVAILSLVDGPRDLRFEFTARALAREFVANGRTVEGVDQIKRFMADEKAQEFLRPKTRLNLGKVMKYHPERAEEFFELVTDYQPAATSTVTSCTANIQNKLRAEAGAVGHNREAPDSGIKFRPPSSTKPMEGRRALAGERLSGMSISHSGLGLARGALNRRRPNADRSPRFITEKNVPVSNLDVD
ncbi:hypothetical protein A1Q1_02308 [Trichosporon asahii var. asahii CBS 2479]|uniref:Uncharacterized protein n=1 Tax=Trichosporon asahii var. asahii (strain ATCC 90039 / CBS 2479 / JCM 2466 / KCTC 7840 / NBRC 103889/ NCYC 2677 / UAMH 7654) TaxID=1186058 RepID=J5T1J5_TRIAS|nr:hypothetical protein A1Q1_02308 [Trichosporon asahii var. asahii CBS 2479]EJT48671.1 hypothetical protein A1Q1_02308 [Trichosporon asahii var. asahii CBS 2479]